MASVKQANAMIMAKTLHITEQPATRQLLICTTYYTIDYP